MPLVIGLFEHDEGARSAVTYLKSIGVDHRSIEVEAYNPKVPTKSSGHSPGDGEKGGIEQGKIVRAEVPERCFVQASEAFLNLARKK